MRPQKRHSKSMARQFVRDYLMVSLIPILLLVVFVTSGAWVAKTYLDGLIRDSLAEFNRSAELHLEQLGQKIVRSKARDVAQQIAIFLASHSNVSITELQSVPEFERIAIQSVGKTGYTCLYEAGTGIMRFHPNERLINRNMHFLAEDLPSWWTIFRPTLTGDECSGYYDWLEPDGTVRRKYMTMTPVPWQHQGKTLMIAATTYIDEFSGPMAAMKSQVLDITAQYQEYAADQGVLVAGGIVGILLFALGVVYVSGRRAARRYILPIEGLADAAKELGKGEWDPNVDAAMVGRYDEIGVLAREFSDMRAQLKSAFQRLEERYAELRETQAALEESEEHYRTLFDSVPVGLYRSTPDGRITDANPTLVAMLGYPDREAFLSQDASALYVRQEDRLSWMQRLQDKEGHDRTEVKMRKHTGDVIWVEDYSRAVRDAEGCVLCYEGSLKDVTERKNAEESLRESEENYRRLYGEAKQAEEVYRSLLSSSADAIAIYDLEGRTRYVSPAFTALFKWTLEELEHKPIPFVPESEKEITDALFQELRQDGTPCQGYETKRYTKSGDIVDVGISASRYDDSNGDPAGILVVIRDISERKRLEEQLMRAQKMEAIGTLAGGIAHDFNNMMMGVLGSVSLMLNDTRTDYPHYDKLRRIEDLIHSASRLTSQLLGYARKGKYEIQPLDLTHLLKESTDTFGRTRREVGIHLDLAPDLQSIEADRSQMEQILMNLFVNAADAMAQGGVLSISAKNVTHREMRLKLFAPKPGPYVKLCVRDTGIGMDRDTLERIFDPFFTTKEMGRGTGLGLASVYGIVKGHGGYIDVESTKGQGTTFYLYLPASGNRECSRGERKDRIHRGKGTVLLVDDEESVLEVGGQLLLHLGFEVLKAKNGDEALRLYEENRERIDLVILDMIMPGKGGGEVYDVLKGMNPQVKVLLCSGYSLEGQAAEIMARGCDGFLQKPFDLSLLSSKVKEILHEAESVQGS